MGFALKVESVAGGTIEEHFAELIAFSKKLDVILISDANGVDVVVGPHHTVEGLMKTYFPKSEDKDHE